MHADLSWTFAGTRWSGAVEAGFGLQRFAYRLEQARITHPQPFPDVAYRYLRPGFAGRFLAWPRLAVQARAHYRAVVSTGPLTSANWFPGAKARGFDGGLSLDWQFQRWLALGLGYELRRYHLDFTAGRSVRDSAGAVDLYQTLLVRVDVALGGT
jgi:hypothetical protein